MSFLSKTGEIFGGLIFSLSLGFLIVFIALANFTQYNNLQPIMTNLIVNQFRQNLTQTQIDFLYSDLTDQCKSSATANVPLGNNNSASLKCEDVKNSNSTDIPNLIAKNLFDQIYYKKYDCSFLNCIKDLSFQKGTVETNQKFQIVLTAKANEFFTKNQIFLIGGMFLGIALIIVSVRVWYNILKNVGFTLLFVGITYLLIPLMKSSFIGQVTGMDLSAVVDALFKPIIMLLRISLILGIIFTATGYIASYLLKPPEKKKS